MNSEGLHPDLRPARCRGLRKSTWRNSRFSEIRLVKKRLEFALTSAELVT